MADKQKPMKTRIRTDEMFSTLVSAQDCSLRVISGPHEGLEIPFDQELIRIGRADWCDLILVEDHWVSNVHCECWLDTHGVRLRDLHSRNGVLSGACKLFDAYLSEGAVFQVGRSSVQLITHDQRRELAIKYCDESGTLVGRSESMREVFSMLSRLSKVNANTLLTGETGTGKTSVARAIHMQTKHDPDKFVVVNCGALPANLIEAQLFGYEKGAFTGADKQYKGFFEQADGGTLFLDEIAELPLDLQPKLLDVLERRKIRRLGGKSEIEVDFRLLTATHRHLPDVVAKREFREDLYFRLSVVVIDIPPLRERIEDIPLLVNSFLEDLAPQREVRLSNNAMEALQRQLWPGNIRQLRNTLQYALTFLDGDLMATQDIQVAYEASRTTHWLDEDASESPTHTAPQATPANTASTENPANPAAQSPQPQRSTPSEAQPGANLPHTLLEIMPSFPLSKQNNPLSMKEFMEELEKVLVEQALKETKQNAQEASKLLGISLGWLYNRTRKYKLEIKTKTRKARS